MNSELFFRVKKQYDITRYPALKQLGGVCYYNHILKYYDWFFPLKNYDCIVAIMAEPITIEGYQTTINTPIQIEGYKGISGCKVVEFPKAFQIIEYRKSKSTGETYERKRLLPKQTVLAVWKVLQTFPLNKEIRCSTIAERICKEYLLIDEPTFRRFFRGESGTFDWSKFIGSRSLKKNAGYFEYYYYPLKVLEYKGVIQYGQRSSARIKETLEFQTVFTEVVQ